MNLILSVPDRIDPSFADSVLSLTINTADLNNIKLNSNFATNINNIYLSATSLAILDTSSNPLLAVTTRIPPDVYTADTGGPMLDRFSLDMNTGTLTLTFDEIVVPSTLNVRIIHTYIYT